MCRIVDKYGTVFNSSEQFYHVGKTYVFDDPEARKAIMSLVSPNAMKKRSRLIKGFSTPVWRQYAYQRLYQANYLKFTQSPELGDHLLGTRQYIAEASPKDGYWGIKLHMLDPRAEWTSNWQGQNLMGVILMDIRSRLNQERSEVSYSYVLLVVN